MNASLFVSHDEWIDEFLWSSYENGCRAASTSKREKNEVLLQKKKHVMRYDAVLPYQMLTIDSVQGYILPTIVPKASQCV